MVNENLHIHRAKKEESDGIRSTGINTPGHQPSNIYVDREFDVVTYIVFHSHY